MKSLWADVSRPAFPALEGEQTADVLVIGGGMAGVLCARLLHDAGVDCMLLEGDRLGSGATGNTTAKITSQHGLIYSQLMRSMGAELAKQYLDINQRAIREFFRLAQGIDCGISEQSAHVYSLTDRDAVERETLAALLLGAPARFVETVPLPMAIQGAIRFERQAQFDPLKFLVGVAQGLRIHERSFVREIRGPMAHTAHGSVRARSIIIATHFPILNRMGGYPLKMYQHRSYAIAFSGAADVHGMYLDCAPDGLSFRNHGELLLIGGGDHRTGEPGQGYAAPRAFAGQHYPDAIERCHWAAQDCISLDGAPYIGRYARGAGELFVATGFNKWGMTGSMVAAMLLTGHLTGKPDPCAAVFSPSRPLRPLPLLANAISSTLNLLTPRIRRCTHLGCALRWNALEHSWDCPCHGSRFDAQGAVLENPAMRHLPRR